MPSELESTVSQVFDQVLPRTGTGYEVRAGQKHMALLIARAFEQKSRIAIEAATGTGKSLAYLIPALLESSSPGNQTIVSTKTLQLQNQLLQKEIPSVLSILPQPKLVALARGWSNYLCLRRFESFSDNPVSGSEVWLERLRRQTQESHGAVTRDNCGVPSKDWLHLKADPLDCAKRLCPHFSACGLFKERKSLESADLIVTNHAFLLSDLRLRRRGNPLLPNAAHLIVDEAHRLDEVATEHLAVKLELESVLETLGGGTTAGSSWMDATRFRIAVHLGPALASKVLDRLARVTWLLKSARDSAETFWLCLDRLGAEFCRSLQRGSAPMASLSLPEGEDAALSAAAFLTHLTDCATECSALCLECYSELETPEFPELENFVSRLTHLKLDLEFLLEASSPEWVYSIEYPSRSLLARPVDSSAILEQELFTNFHSVCLTSASLTVGSSFKFLLDRIGFQNQPEDRHVISSPFRPEEKAFIGFVNDTPEPNQDDYPDIIAPAVVQLVTGLGGRTLLLATSHRRLKEYEALLSHGLLGSGVRILRQGTRPTSELIATFRSPGRWLLLGVDSLWEGVDIPGSQLCCVIVTKLPFPVPSDPLFAARSERIENGGGNSFRELSLPAACLKLKQGFGRLLRTHQDKGIFLVFDSRLQRRWYGPTLVQSLPTASPFKGGLSEVVHEALNWAETHLEQST